MADNYGKIFPEMYSGSMYGAGVHVFAVFPWMLAHKDSRGHVEVNPVRVAAELGATKEQIESALEYLMRPDPDSRSPDEQGRRIVRIGQFEYRLVNHAKYKIKGRSRDRTEYMRERKRENRQDVKMGNQPSFLAQKRELSTIVNQNRAIADTDTDITNRETTSVVSCPDPKKKPSVRAAVCFDYSASKLVGITEDDWTVWQTAFPAVDVRGEVLKAALWLRDNPTRRKKNVRRFLTNWLGRVQERGGNHGTGPPPPADIRKALEDFWKKKGKGDE